MKTLFASLLMVFLFAGCMKDDACNFDPCLPKAPANEIAQVEAYLASNNITGATLHCSGMYYKIIAAGSGATPTPCNTITINYVGKLTNGNVFDFTDASTGPRTFPLNNLIKGWQNGIPFIKAGGKIQLFIPPTLGYGSQSSSSIPANSVIIFDIDLIGVR